MDSKDSSGIFLKLEGVSKSYGETEALKNLNLVANKGEILSILGPSGAGKTTTLKVIAGLENVQKGKVIFNNEVINNLEPMERNMAMVFEAYAIYPHVSVFENLASPLYALKWEKAKIKEKVESIAELLGMSPYLNRAPANLSGGQRQRVALGRALTKPADLFLMDEPIAHLDAKLRYQMNAEFKNLQKKLNISMVYVTHDWEEALSLGDHILILNNGIVNQYSISKNIYNKPANTFVAQIVGDPPMNLLKFKLITKESKNFLKLNSIEIPIEKKIKDSGSEVIVGFRPNKIDIVSESTPYSIKTEVYSIERYGVNTVISFKINKDIIKAKFVTEKDLKIKDKVSIKLNLENACIFNNNKDLIEVLGDNNG